MSFSIESKLGDLLDNEQTKAILEKHLPGISTHPQIAMGKGFALSMVAKFSGGLITDELLQKVDADLKALGWRPHEKRPRDAGVFVGRASSCRAQLPQFSVSCAHSAASGYTLQRIFLTSFRPFLS